MVPDPDSLHILVYPDEALRRETEPVTRFDEALRAIVNRMFLLMDEAEGIGLAAPQVGISKRFFIMGEHEGQPSAVFINPRIEYPDLPLESDEEGCLSLPDIRVNVRRPPTVHVEAFDVHGQPFSLEVEGLTARVIQHEFDHLNGVLIIDKMSPMDRLANRRKIRDLTVAGRKG